MAIWCACGQGLCLSGYVAYMLFLSDISFYVNIELKEQLFVWFCKHWIWILLKKLTN